MTKSRRYPIQVYGQAGRVRWRTSDARTHDTKAHAVRAQNAIGIVDAPPSSTVGHGFIVGFGTIFALTIGAIGIIGWQSVSWLETGIWPTLAIADIVDEPAIRTGWIGADRLLTMPFESPLSLWMLSVAALIGWWLSRSSAN